MKILAYWQTLLLLSSLGYFTNNCHVNAFNCVNSYGSIVPEYNNSSPNDFNNRNSNVPFQVFIHTIAKGDWITVLLDMIMDMDHSSFYAQVTLITIGVIGGTESSLNEERKLVKQIRNGRFQKKFKFIQTNQREDVWEFSTINYMIEQAKLIISKNSAQHFLYMHTKGVNTRTGASLPKWYWRKWMTAWLIKYHELNRVILDHGYDVLGSNPLNLYFRHLSTRVNLNHSWHYSGNFWWATAKYISTLPLLNFDHAISDYERIKAELLVLSKAPDMCAGILGYSNNPHFYNIKDIDFSFYEIDKTPPRFQLIRFKAVEGSVFKNQRNEFFIYHNGSLQTTNKADLLKNHPGFKMRDVAQIHNNDIIL